MNPFYGEIVGTAILILLGDGVVANVALDKTKAEAADWNVICLGWGMAVFVSVFSVAALGGSYVRIGDRRKV